MAGEMMAGEIMDIQPSWCTTAQTQLMTEWSDQSHYLVVDWVCMHGPSGYYQLMVGELTFRQVLYITALSGVCERDEDNHLLKRYCLERDDLNSEAAYITLDRQYPSMMAMRERKLIEHFLDLPIGNISYDTVSALLEEINRLDHEYTYRLPRYSEWSALIGDSLDENHRCVQGGVMRGVFSMGCGFQRPRSIQVGSSMTPSCADDRPVNPEDRSFNTPLGSLCDIHGNQREILRNCPNNIDACIVGRGWMDDFRFIGNQLAPIMIMNTYAGPDLGVRLVRVNR
jgi:hypothetical protein